MEKDWYNGLYIVGLKHELLTWESMGHCSALKPASTGYLELQYLVLPRFALDPRMEGCRA